MAACAADDESGERARFSCLAALRYTVATVVTVLAAVVIVMVINVVVLRPEEFVLSVVQGHVRTSNLYIELPQSEHQPTVSATVGTAVSMASCDDSSISDGDKGADDSRASVSKEHGRSCGGGNHNNLPAGTIETYSLYDPVSSLDLTVILSVDNPSGRGEITCDSMEVRFFDMPYYYSGDGNTSVGMEIDRFDKNQRDGAGAHRRLVRREERLRREGERDPHHHLLHGDKEHQEGRLRLLAGGLRRQRCRSRSRAGRL